MSRHATKHVCAWQFFVCQVVVELKKSKCLFLRALKKVTFRASSLVWLNTWHWIANSRVGHNTRTYKTKYIKNVIVLPALGSLTPGLGIALKPKNAKTIICKNHITMSKPSRSGKMWIQETLSSTTTQAWMNDQVQ